MAKLGTYYGLCPLIDQQNLQGVCEDAETGCVIVTLGNNIAIKYRLEDQKQLHSWRTRDKFTSPVIFDKESLKYVAVFNHMFIRTWNGNEEYLDKLKRYKFNKEIYSLVVCGNTSYVVFNSGEVMKLSQAIDNRKELQLCENGKNNELNVCTAYFQSQEYIGLLSKINEEVFFDCNIFEGKDKRRVNLKLARDLEHIYLVGHILTELEHKNSIQLLTLWSDGKLYSYPIYAEENEATLNPIKIPGNEFALVESINCKHNVTMMSLSDRYIAMHGANYKNEGATLILYNTQFKVSQSRQPLKLFTSESKLWKVENNLILCIGQNLAVVSYRLDTEQLEALVGSHRAEKKNVDADVMVIEDAEIVDWEVNKEKELQLESVPKNIAKQVISFSEQGLSESIMCGELITRLIEAANIQSILSCLNYFKDIPEIFLAQLLKFALSVESSKFKKSKHVKEKNFPKNMQPFARSQLVDKILVQSFSDVLLLPYLHKEIDLSCTLILLQYILYLLFEKDFPLSLKNKDNAKTKLISWACLIFDANYQKILVSRDAKVKKIIINYKNLIDEYLLNTNQKNEALAYLQAYATSKIKTNNAVDETLYKITYENIF